jgi:hypothetical protein
MLALYLYLKHCFKNHEAYREATRLIKKGAILFIFPFKKNIALTVPCGVRIGENRSFDDEYLLILSDFIIREGFSVC